MPDKKQIGVGYIRAAFDSKTINKENRTIDVVFATETPVLRMGWDGMFHEVLTCTTEAVMVERFNNGAGPVLDTHDRYSVKTQLGAVEPNTVSIKNKECRCTIRISKRDDVAGVWKDIEDGILRNISVGYNTHEITIAEKNGELPVYTATRWEPMEVSLVPVPADYNSKVRKADETHEVTIINNKKNNKMALSKQAAEKRKNEILTACRAAGLSEEFAQTLIDADPEEMDINGAREAIITELAKGQRAAAPVVAAPAAKPATDPVKEDGPTERKRAAEIVVACRVAKCTEEETTEFLTGNQSIDEVRAAIINKMAKATPEVSGLNSTFKVGAEEIDKKREGMVNGLISRIDPSAKGADGKIIVPGEYRGMSLLDMAREWMVLDGRSVKGLTPREIAQQALGLVRSGGYSTSDFPNILSNVFNKRLRKAYELQGRTFLPWCTASTATDFKEMSRNQLGDWVFEQVREGGEYKSEKLAETVEKYSVAKWGRIVNINWEAIVNDDLNAFTRIPTHLAAAATQKQSDVVYGILSANAAMADTVALFHSTHGNLAASGGAIDVTTLGTARKAMRSQKSIGDKNHLNLAPKFLVTGPAYEQLALQYTSQNYVSAKSSDINVWAGMMQPIIENRISGNAWYLMADPALIDTIEYSFLDGEELFVEERVGFEVDAYQFKARMVFGAKAIDHRGMYKNAGA